MQLHDLEHALAEEHTAELQVAATQATAECR